MTAVDEAFCAAAIDALDAEIGVLAARRQLFDNLRATFQPVAAPAPQVSPDPVVTKEAHPARRTPRGAPRSKRVTAPGSIDYREVANAMNDAFAAKKPIIPFLAERFGVSTSTAKNWPPKVRKLGLLQVAVGRPPATVPVATDVPTTAKSNGGSTRVLMCDECDAEFPAERVRDMNRHVLAAHNRRPTMAERTPAPKGGGA